jgi:hypothetical protein
MIKPAFYEHVALTGFVGLPLQVLKLKAPSSDGRFFLDRRGLRLTYRNADHQRFWANHKPSLKVLNVRVLLGSIVPF